MTSTEADAELTLAESGLLLEGDQLSVVEWWSGRTLATHALGSLGIRVDERWEPLLLLPVALFWAVAAYALYAHVPRNYPVVAGLLGLLGGLPLVGLLKLRRRVLRLEPEGGGEPLILPLREPRPAQDRFLMELRRRHLRAAADAAR